MRFRRFQISILLVGGQVNRKRLWWKPRSVVRVAIVGPVEIVVRKDITGSLLGGSYTFHVNGPSSIRGRCPLILRPVEFRLGRVSVSEPGVGAR